MKKLTVLILAVSILFAATLTAAGAKEDADLSALGGGAKVYTIGVSKLMAHPALDAIATGIDDYLKTTDVNYKIHLENANGDISTCASIAQLFKDEKVDVAVGIATPTAQAIANAMPDTLQVFATVTDPVSAGLVGYDNICGVSDMIPVSAHLELLARLTGCKKVGMVYTSTEANGVAIMEKAKEAAAEQGLELITVAVNNSAEVRMAALSIIDRVDAMYVANDNTVISAVQALSDVCAAEKVPLFSADTTSSFGTDVLISGGFNYYKSGILVGKLIEKVIKGESPKEIGTQYLDADSLELYLNLDMAKQLGINFSEDLLKNASYIVENGEVKEV
jgi:ABC-type uncharacterized transport system, periplasmic component